MSATSERDHGGQCDPQQTELAIGETVRLFACSPTKLLTWVDCPRKFRWTYLQRPPSAAAGSWAHLSYGSSAHSALRAWFALPRPSRTIAAIGNLVHKLWVVDGYRDAVQANQWLARTIDQVQGYASRLSDYDEPLGIERTVGMRTSRLAFSGRIDRIDDRGGHAVVVDYKMGRDVPTDLDARASLPLALYADATQRTLRRPCRTVELHHVPSGLVASWEHSDDSIARHVARAEQIGDEAHAASRVEQADADIDEVFPPKPGALCSWCDFHRNCPAGQAVGPARRSWEGLPELEITETVR